jgi:hypothetical protein
MWLDPRLLFWVLTISFIVLNAIVISYVAIVGGCTIDELSASILRWYNQRLLSKGVDELGNIFLNCIILPLEELSRDYP